MTFHIFTVGTITTALKAKKALLSHSIPAEINKLTSNTDGCLYGVQIPMVHVENAKRILKSNNIFVNP